MTSKKTYNLQLTTSQRGFTLIEATVAATVFAVSMTSIVGVYTSIQRLNRQSTALQALEQNARFVSEDLTKIISNGKIDYARYVGGVPQPYAANLYLRDKDQSEIWIYKSGNYLVMDRTGAGSSNFTGREIRVLDFKVYIWPSANPFPKTVGSPKEQPTVTIYLDLESNLGQQNVTRTSFQTTVATREYSE